MQLKARCKHTFWWRRLHEYFMSQIRRQSRRGTHCMMHVYVGVIACLYLSLFPSPTLPLCVCALRSMEIRNAGRLMVAHGARFHSNASDNCHEFSMPHRVCWMGQLGARHGCSCIGGVGRGWYMAKCQGIMHEYQLSNAKLNESSITLFQLKQRQIERKPDCMGGKLVRFTTPSLPTPCPRFRPSEVCSVN